MASGTFGRGTHYDNNATRNQTERKINTMAMMPDYKYEYDETNDEIHLYDETGTELNHSPVDVSGDTGREIPGDLLQTVANELEQEIHDAQNDSTTDHEITDRALDLVGVLLLPEYNIEEK